MVICMPPSPITATTGSCRKPELLPGRQVKSKAHSTQAAGSDIGSRMIETGVPAYHHLMLPPHLIPKSHHPLLCRWAGAYHLCHGERTRLWILFILDYYFIFFSSTVLWNFSNHRSWDRLIMPLVSKGSVSLQLPQTGYRCFYILSISAGSISRWMMAACLTRIYPICQSLPDHPKRMPTATSTSHSLVKILGLLPCMPSMPTFKMICWQGAFAHNGPPPEYLIFQSRLWALFRTSEEHTLAKNKKGSLCLVDQGYVACSM